MSRLITITLGVTNRTDYVKQCLKTLREAYEYTNPAFQNRLKLLIACEPGDETRRICEDIDWIDKEVIMNDKKLGVRVNPYRILDYAFSVSDFNLHLEDDLVFSKDLFRLLEIYEKTERENPNKIFIYDFFCDVDKNSSELPNKYSFYIKNAFKGLGWATTKKNWDIIKQIWFRDCVHYKKLALGFNRHNYGWDWSLNHFTQLYGLPSLKITYPLTKHIGLYGVHVAGNKQFQADNFDYLQMLDGIEIDTPTIDIKELDYDDCNKFIQDNVDFTDLRYYDPTR